MLSRLGLRGIARPAQSFVRNQAIRSLNTVRTTADAEQEILVEQRKNRPVSPHLTIYQPQLTWVLSSFHRVTGLYLAGGFYGLTCTYAFASLFGYHIDSTVIQEAFYGLNPIAQYALKAGMVFPFFFHFGNGIRHLIWDAGKELTIKGIYRTGYAVLAFTALMGGVYTLI
ncbi:SDH6 [Cyberlindnera jadinii]|uniref:Cytochrome b560 subunit of succinate dehydrogenase n=1 Tax=Cyberlindnera jadinii (strain ATCC 18201 / CBS 1600 / BCRC 20928 / JCM 3617 / NBRC 0987 / NRRL Y-1542) TaxID=983966 RepID=A0A0H5CCB2_CYBJN|nr:cytochrome b560 subunit of succinate dehydrogenase [Cyberlindnera jadinii NRRL Y-1542]ODV72740.1 cytochrome b560 subunit of succinate dehydrogenase [Cyberlindnera jadinii NRRL Y-1542]CEP22234.1 SDH6 [Cyberlindnera jadinii]